MAIENFLALGLFLSFSRLYESSKPLCISFICVTILLHLCFFLVYERLFRSLSNEFKTQRENILYSCMTRKNLNDEGDNNNDNNDNNDNNNIQIHQCEICFEAIEKHKNDCVELKCSCKDKFYHEDCIKNWFLTSKNTCPFCRIPFNFD